MVQHTLDGLAIGALGLLLVLLLAAYWVAAKKQWRAGHDWSRWRAVSFVAGIVLLAVALSPPIAQLAHHDFRGHMVQHLLLGMLAPLGLVFAAPMTLLLRTVSASLARRIIALLHTRLVRCISDPITALVLNVGGMYLLYLTPLYALTHSSPALHVLVHWHFLAAGYLFVWAIAGPDPAPHRASLRARLIVLFVGIAAHSTLGKLMYAYLWPRGTDHGVDEIRAGAKLMYYGGDVAELLLVIALFATWYANSARLQMPPSRTYR